jgi:anti-sigma factor RsiW
MLSEHADGTLSPVQWSKLEQHLTRCVRCRQAYEADNALQDVLGIHTGLLDSNSARAFDDRVVAALADTGALSAVGGSRWTLAQRWAQARWEALPFPFLTQVAGGGLVAASVTMLCLLTSLHARGPVETPPGNSGMVAVTRNEPPVPLESLLRNPAPRAALLWTSSATPPARSFDPPPAERQSF